LVTGHAADGNTGRAAKLCNLLNARITPARSEGDVVKAPAASRQSLFNRVNAKNNFHRKASIAGREKYWRGTKGRSNDLGKRVMAAVAVHARRDVFWFLFSEQQNASNQSGDASDHKFAKNLGPLSRHDLGHRQVRDQSLSQRLQKLAQNQSQCDVQRRRRCEPVRRFAGHEKHNQQTPQKTSNPVVRPFAAEPVVMAAAQMPVQMDEKSEK